MISSGSIPKLALYGLVVGGVLVGCGGGGDIKIAPVTTDTSTDNSVNNSNNVAAAAENPCASNGIIQGTYDGTNCNYSTAFADSGNNITTDITLVDLDNDGAHLFSGSLFIGEAHQGAELAAAGISEGGDGPQLTVEAGATVAFLDNTKFVIIMRGSTISAVGTAAAPITFTSFSDVNGTLPSPEAVQQWGGMVINGFGVTNKCAYTGTRGAAGFAQVGDCDVAAEGAEGLDESYYGGANDADTSGRLEYFIVKHTGAQVANGDELNGISFGGVGSNTVVENVQVYATYDDGYEFFGGAVNVTNFVALYVNDDSIDIDEGYNGTITNALVIQSATNGNRCVEADGIGSYSSKSAETITDIQTRNLNSRPTIKNLTCIYSANQKVGGTTVSGAAATGTHDPGAGLRLREGLWPTIENALVIGSFSVAEAGSDNWAIRVDDTVADAFVAGNASITGSLFAAEDKSSKQINGQDVDVYLTANGGNVFADITGAVNATASTDTGLQLLEGTPPIYSIAAASSLPIITPAGSRSYTGALSTGATDWEAGWTYGIYDANRGQALWFE